MNWRKICHLPTIFSIEFKHPFMIGIFDIFFISKIKWKKDEKFQQQQQQWKPQQQQKNTHFVRFI